jgi:hypothetical protein
MDDGSRRLGLVECELAEMRGVAPHLVAKADLIAESGAMRRELHALEIRLREAIVERDAKLVAVIVETDAKLTAAIAAMNTRLSVVEAYLEARRIFK